MSDESLRVAITGAGGYIGRSLINRLIDNPRIGFILALDISRIAERNNSKLTSVEQDISHPLGDILSEYNINTVVHLAYLLRPQHNPEDARKVNIDGTRNILAACTSSSVSTFVYLSSTSVYGAHPTNAKEFREEDTPKPVEGFQYSEHKVEAENLISAFLDLNPDVTVTVLRSCPVIGPTADNFIARTFRKSILVAVKGHDPEMQLLHEDDLASIITLCTINKTHGVFNLAGDGSIRWSQMAKTLDHKLITLPKVILYPLTAFTWALRLQNNSMPQGLDLIRFPWIASTDKIKRQLDFEFRYSATEAWMSFVNRCS